MNTASLRVIIHEQALRHNIRLLQQRHGAFFAVIKADAYGHGCLATARVLRSEGVRHMAVGTVGEAALVRQQNPEAELLPLLGLIAPDDAELAVRTGVTLPVHSHENLAALLAGTAGAPLDVAIKIDSGMGRLGFTPEELPDIVQLLQAAPQLRPTLALSHLASADSPAHDDFTREQCARFGQAVACLRRVWPDLRTSLGNSPGALGWGDVAGDLPRPGLILYGINPFEGTVHEALGAPFLPVMEATAPVLALRTLAAGQSLGYGCSFVADKPMQVAVIGVGYADGYLRALSNGGLGAAHDTTPDSGSAVVLHGQRAPIRGRICMQMCMVEVTHIPNVQVGQIASLLGGKSKAAIRAEELARWAGTIPYELVCALGKGPRREEEN